MELTELLLEMLLVTLALIGGLVSVGLSLAIKKIGCIDQKVSQNQQTLIRVTTIMAIAHPDIFKSESAMRLVTPPTTLKEAEAWARGYLGISGEVRK